MSDELGPGAGRSERQNVLDAVRSDRRKLLSGILHSDESDALPESNTVRSTADQTDIDITVGLGQEGKSSEETGRVKLTVNLPEREMATLRGIAAKRDISLTDAVRRAIAMEQFIEEVEGQGGKLLVEQPDHSMRQLLLR